MPDRPLTDEETRKFVKEHATGDILHALKIFLEEKTKPTLHDLCISELYSALEGMKKIVIKQGRQIKALEEQKR